MGGWVEEAGCMLTRSALLLCYVYGGSRVQAFEEKVLLLILKKEKGRREGNHQQARATRLLIALIVCAQRVTCSNTQVSFMASEGTLAFCIFPNGGI